MPIAYSAVTEGTPRSADREKWTLAEPRRANDRASTILAVPYRQPFLTVADWTTMRSATAHISSGITEDGVTPDGNGGLE